jgi:hypothetical protein
MLRVKVHRVKRVVFEGKGRKNGDILRFHQFLRTYDQSDARIESQSRAYRGEREEGRT